jgi:hypothetical protein
MSLHSGFVGLLRKVDNIFNTRNGAISQKMRIVTSCFNCTQTELSHLIPLKGIIAVYFEQHSVVQAEKRAVGQRTNLRSMHVDISFQALKCSKIWHNKQDKIERQRR